NDCRVLATITVSLVFDLPHVDGVRQQPVDLAAAEGPAPIDPSGRDRPGFWAPDTSSEQFDLDLGDRAGVAIEGENRPYDVGFFLMDHQGALVGPIAKRHEATHP